MKEESKKAGLKLNIQKIKIIAFSPITSWQIHEETMETVTDFIFFSKITVDGDYSHEIKRHLLLGKKSCDKPRKCTKKQRHCFTNKGLYSKSYGFSCSHVQIWVGPERRLSAEELRLSNCRVGEDFESPLDSKIKPVNPKTNQSWIFIERTDAEALILWPPDVKSWFVGKDPDAGKVSGQ